MPRITVSVAKIARKAGQTSYLWGPFESDILKAVNPDETVTRYEKEWRFSQPQLQGRFLVGKLGFTKISDDTETTYDEARKDFIDFPSQARQIYYSQWVLDIDSQIICFELRPPKIRYNTFVGAVHGFLDLHRDLAFTVEPVHRPEHFYEWAESVDMIIGFSADFRAANPDYRPRLERLKTMLKESNADNASLSVKSNGNNPGPGLNIANSVLGELVEYQRDGYATVKARGVKGDSVRQFNSSRRIETEQLTIEKGTLEDHYVWHLLMEFFHRLRMRK